MNVGITDVMLASFMQGTSVGLVWVPLVVATFATLDKQVLGRDDSRIPPFTEYWEQHLHLT